MSLGRASTIEAVREGINTKGAPLWRRCAKTRHGFVAIVTIVVLAAATLIPATTAQGGGKYGHLDRALVGVGVCSTGRRRRRHEHQPLCWTAPGSLRPPVRTTGLSLATSTSFWPGTSGGDVPVRTVTVPEGKALFFPVINTRSGQRRRPAHQFQGPRTQGAGQGQHRHGPRARLPRSTEITSGESSGCNPPRSTTGCRTRTASTTTSASSVPSSRGGSSRRSAMATGFTSRRCPPGEYVLNFGERQLFPGGF